MLDEFSRDEILATEVLLSLKATNPVIWKVRKAVLNHVYSILLENLRFRVKQNEVDYFVIAQKVEYSLFFNSETLDDYADLETLRHRVLTLVFNLLFC